jgi:CheY-like chemotaxis protein
VVDTDKTKVPQTLLLADDSITIQRVIELTFAEEDIRVVAVGDGDQAIQRLESEPPDIVLADVGMPGCSGYDVAQYIKESPKLAHIPVLLLTGAFEPVDQARASRVGCDGVLAKPFEPQMVIGRVKELLGRPRPDRDLKEVDLALASFPAGERWSPSLSGSGFEPASPPPAPPLPNALDYFDQLDRAFSELSGAPSLPDKPVQPAGKVDWFNAEQAPAASPEPTPVGDARLRGGAHEGADLDLPLGHGPAPPIDFDKYPALEPDVEPPMSGLTALPSEPTEPPPAQPEASAGTVTLPPVAEAFAALLEAERNEVSHDMAPWWPVSGATAAFDEDIIVEKVTYRVLERLSDRIIRETVSDIVSSVADRLVREEIERIKASTGSAS